MSSDAIWQRYGERDPYYAVLTLDAYRSETIAENRDAFLASGEAAVSNVLGQVEEAIGPVQRGHALDFGAGVGRLSLPLAGRFAKVSSVDVSPGMLRELERNAASNGIGHIAPYSDLAAVCEPVDFALSLIVLQHIGTRRGLDAILTIWDKLGPGGVLALEVPIASSYSRLWRLVRALRDRLPFVQPVWNRLRGRPVHDGGMQMNLYPLPVIAEALFARGARAVSLLPSAPDPGFAGALIVCRKA